MTEEMQDKVATYCGSDINIDGTCTCVQPTGGKERMMASKYCQICDGTGRPTLENLLSKVDKLSEDILQLSSVAGDVCEPSRKFLQLAWWHAEDAIRALTGECSMAKIPRLGHQAHHSSYCGTCSLYKRLKSLAERLGRSM